MRLISKIALTTVIATASIITVAQAQDTLANWTFENTAITGSTGSDFSYGIADSGLSMVGSSATGHHDSAATDYSFTAGQGSTRALTANNWSVNDYWQFSLNTVGYENLTVSLGQTGSNTGPANFQIQYSTDGATFSNFGAPYTLASTSFATKTFDLSMVPAVNTAVNVYFRVADTSTTSINNGSVGASGSDRIDNFIVTATLIPEPSVYMLLGVGLLLCGQRFMRGRRNRSNV